MVDGPQSMVEGALHRIVYDATIDDAADVAFRFANRTKAFPKQIRQNVVIAGAFAGLALIAVWIFRVGAGTPLEFALLVAAGVVFGIIFAATFRRFLEKEIRRQNRKMVAEQFGGNTTIQSELELRPDAVWVRQAGMEMTFPWDLCTGVQDNPGDIELNFSPGICVVRNRHFTSPAERQNFLETARRLTAHARSG